MNKQPPSQGMCLWLAQMYWEMKPRTKAYEQRSWDYLVMWGFYEMFLADWNERHGIKSNIELH